jgi:hypothetical protein
LPEDSLVALLLAVEPLGPAGVAGCASVKASATPPLSTKVAVSTAMATGFFIMALSSSGRTRHLNESLLLMMRCAGCLEEPQQTR